MRLGGVDGYCYTNSLDAFEENYAKGHRVFEVDFDLTEENVMVAAHGQKNWHHITGCSEDVPFTIGQFLSRPIYDRYIPLDYQDVVDLMAEYPDIYIVTDNKYSDPVHVTVQFSQLVLYAKQTCPEVLDRIIPQIYKEEMLDWIMEIYPFRSVIFTLYATKWTPESVFDFCLESGVRFITMWNYLMTPEILENWHTIGIKTAVHTENDLDAAKAFYDMGVNAIYTDFLVPSDVLS